MPVSTLGDNRLLAFYCTHSDESYEPSDGVYSNDKRGSIYEVAQALADELEEDGVPRRLYRMRCIIRMMRAHTAAVGKPLFNC